MSKPDGKKSKDKKNAAPVKPAGINKEARTAANKARRIAAEAARQQAAREKNQRLTTLRMERKEDAEERARELTEEQQRALAWEAHENRVSLKALMLAKQAVAQKQAREQQARALREGWALRHGRLPLATAFHDVK